jgi:mRNA interferase RelE/StbE
MHYTIQFLKRAERDLAGLPTAEKARVLEAIMALSVQPRPPQAKALTGEFKGYLRIRVGSYRIVYQIQSEVLVVMIIRIGHRREVYRRR